MYAEFGAYFLDKTEILTAMSVAEQGKESIMITDIEENEIVSYCVDTVLE